MGIDTSIIALAMRSVGRSFYGGCVENLGGAPMGKGHNNDSKPFDLHTACYLKPVFAAYDNPSVRKIVIKAGVKTVKSFAAEVMAAHHICHGNGDTAIYFGSGDVADDQSTTRIVDFYRGIPSFAKKLSLIDNRFDITNGAIKFPDKTLRVLPANLANTQGLNLGCVVVCDAFVTGRDGMIDQAIARTTQYAEDKKIILESQGGEEGYDFDRHYDDTNQQELHVACPCCGTDCLWNWRGWHLVRPDDFKAVVPAGSTKTLEELTAELLAPERRDCGFKHGENYKLENGEYNEQAILDDTYYECYHCGEKWRDTPSVRRKLDESSKYVPARTTALAGNVGFNFPQWINRRLPWGQMMLDFKRHNLTNSQFGNVEPLKVWWQKTAARTWTKEITAQRATVVTGSYDIKEKIFDEVCRVMSVDCQQDDAMTATTGKSTLGKYWWVARAIDKSGNLFQLSRGYGNIEDWQSEQKRLEISNENVGIDGGNWRHEVIDLAAKNISPYSRRLRKHGRWREEQIWHTYTVLVGSGKRISWKWTDGRSRSASMMQPQARRVTLLGQPREIKVPLYEWSNLSVKDQLSEIIRGGEGRVQFKSLSRNQLPEAVQLKESGNLTYENQMAAEYRTLKKNGVPYWEKSRPDNHYFDCELGCLVLLGLGGYLGIAASPEGSETG